MCQTVLIYLSCIRPGSIPSKQGIRNLSLPILCFIGTHSTVVNGHHVLASGKSQMSVPDSADLPYSGLSCIRPGSILSKQGIRNLHLPNLCFIGTHSTAVNGQHVPASGKSQISVPDSADSGVELSVSGQYMPEMTPVLEHEEEEYEDMTSRRILGLTPNLAPPIFCCRRQSKILPLFQK